MVARRLFNTDDAAVLRDHYMAMRASGSYKDDFVGVDPRDDDPLRKYPRLIMMHRWDIRSLRWLIDARLSSHIAAFCDGIEPFAVQTMVYFKPAGARGQALHQDQYYLRVKPGTSIAAWMALDESDEENGCMQVVPGTHKLPVLCTIPADTKESMTDVTVPLPEGYKPRAVPMSTGDVLFFNGSIIHGSFPNTSNNRFRRSLIGHYIAGDAREVGKWYFPVLRMDGSEVKLEESDYGGPCGVFAREDGQEVVQMRGRRTNETADTVGIEGGWLPGEKQKYGQ